VCRAALLQAAWSCGTFRSTPTPGEPDAEPTPAPTVRHLGLLGLAWLPLAGQAAGTTGSGKAATETRALPEFQAIELSGSMDLKVRQGSPQSVQVQADDNLLPLLETVVEGSGAEAR
jgi:hypothetical protein